MRPGKQCVGLASTWKWSSERHPERSRGACRQRDGLVDRSNEQRPRRLPATSPTSRTIPLFPRFSHSPLAPFGPSCALRHSAKTESSRDLMAIPSPACRPRGPGTGRVPVGRNGVGGSHAELSTRPGAGLDRAARHQDLCALAVVLLVARLRGGQRRRSSPAPVPWRRSAVSPAPPSA